MYNQKVPKKNAKLIKIKSLKKKKGAQYNISKIYKTVEVWFEREKPNQKYAPVLFLCRVSVKLVATSTLTTFRITHAHGPHKSP